MPQPLLLSAGFQGTIVAYGYGAGERLFNTGNRPDDVALLHTFDGASLIFVGTSSYSAEAGAYPSTPDSGPANRYAAGTFYFEPATEQAKLAGTLTGGKIKITWTAGFLESAPEITGPWATVPGAVSGIEIPASAKRQFYRLKP